MVGDPIKEGTSLSVASVIRTCRSTQRQVRTWLLQDSRYLEYAGPEREPELLPLRLFWVSPDSFKRRRALEVIS